MGFVHCLTDRAELHWHATGKAAVPHHHHHEAPDSQTSLWECCDWNVLYRPAAPDLGLQLLVGSTVLALNFGEARPIFLVTQFKHKHSPNHAASALKFVRTLRAPNAPPTLA